jgi:hypothetical protein
MTVTYVLMLSSCQYVYEQPGIHACVAGGSAVLCVQRLVTQGLR